VTEQALTPSQVKKVGKVLRDFDFSSGLWPEEIDQAFAVVDAYRASFRSALATANMGLRAMLKGKKVKSRGKVSQRLKRRATIVDKLKRYPAMQLNTMHDIAGCRAIVESVAKLRAIQARWMRTNRVRRVYDYIEEPKEDGYRGVHLVVEYHGKKVEVQLRTEVQHEWAFTVERLGGRIGKDLKSGLGPAEVRAFFKVVSEAMAMDERGEAVPAELTEKIRQARERAAPFFVPRSDR
jgi:ppGpp synthetase/RelA/SpoT-type nucleotidyltranferase